MPLYMDVHERLPEGVTVESVADARRRDVEIQEQHGVRYRRYWVDAEARKAFCLVEAPSPEAAAAVHREAHGLVANRIYQVVEGN